MVLNDAARRLLESSALAHLVTTNADGTPQVSVIWVGLDGDEIVAGHLNPSQLKILNMQRNPQIALSVEAGEVNANGLHEYLVVYGTARLTDGGAAALLQDLAHVYLGPDVTFPPMENPPPGVVTHITVDRITGMGDWSTRASD